MAKPGLCDRSPFFPFQGLDLLKWASLLREEVRQLEMEGLQKIKLAVAGSEAEGLYGLLRGAISHSSCPPSHPNPTQNTTMLHHTTISHLPPQESRGAEPEASVPVVGGVGLALKAPLQLFLKLQRWPSPPHMAPLCLAVGSTKRVYKCQVEGCSEGPSTSHAAIYAHMGRDHLGMRLACPFCTMTFLNSDALRCYRKVHSTPVRFLHVLFLILPLNLLFSIYVKGHFMCFCLFICKSCRSARQPGLCVLSMLKVASCVFLFVNVEKKW